MLCLLLNCVQSLNEAKVINEEKYLKKLDSKPDKKLNIFSKPKFKNKIDRSFLDIIKVIIHEKIVGNRNIIEKNAFYKKIHPIHKAKLVKKLINNGFENSSDKHKFNLQTDQNKIKKDMYTQKQVKTEKFKKTKFQNFIFSCMKNESSFSNNRNNLNNEKYLDLNELLRSDIPSYNFRQILNVPNLKMKHTNVETSFTIQDSSKRMEQNILPRRQHK